MDDSCVSNFDYHESEGSAKHHEHTYGLVSTRNGIHTPFESIAIVGMSCEFSGAARDTEGFWNMLMERKHGMKEWPKNRINLDAFYHEDGSRSRNVP